MRIEVRHKTEKKSLAFGTDRATGAFLQIWDTTKYPDPDDENLLVDEDEVMTGLTKEKFLALVEKHGFTEAELNRGVILQP